MTKNYELTYFTSPDLSNEDLRDTILKIGGFIREEQGNIEKTTEPLRKRIESPIKGERFMVIFNFHLSPLKIKNLEKKLKSEKAILRYIILIKKEFSKAKTRRKPGKKTKQPEKKVELKEIDKKIEEILNK